MIFFFLTIGFIIFLLKTKDQVNSNWDKGVYHDRDSVPRDNIMEAYISLGARFILADGQDRGQKIVYMNKYFNRYFPHSIYNFTESLLYAFKHPVTIGTVGAWLKLNLPQKSRRMQVLYFLSGMSVIDGSIGGPELKLLEQLAETLGLSPADLDSVLAIYQRKHTETNSYQSASSKQNAIELCCRILGVSYNASMDEIKKAYRAKVKLHHPDRFATESREQQELAEERFLEIQKAYETLEKLKF